MSERPPPIERPNGKLYRPREIKAHRWEDDSWLGHERQGVVIIGTHDLEHAQRFATEVIQYWFEVGMVATNPEIGWWRSGFDQGELRWIRDEVRGGAGIYFTAEYEEDA